MITTRFYLDSRRANRGTYSLRINITHQRKIASFPLGIQLTVEQWNTTTATIQNHPEAKFLNTLINKRKAEVDTIMLSVASRSRRNLLANITSTSHPAPYLHPHLRGGLATKIP